MNAAAEKPDEAGKSIHDAAESAPARARRCRIGAASNPATISRPRDRASAFSPGARFFFRTRSWFAYAMMANVGEGLLRITHRWPSYGLDFWHNLAAAG
jgi:hypothetical protein